MGVALPRPRVKLWESLADIAWHMEHLEGAVQIYSYDYGQNRIASKFSNNETVPILQCMFTWGLCDVLEI